MRKFGAEGVASAGALLIKKVVYFFVMFMFMFML
jgi:hypothetical protein